MVIHNHQLDVLGFGLNGTLASPHLEKATEIHAFESGAHITFTEDKWTKSSNATVNHTQHRHTDNNNYSITPHLEFFSSLVRH